MRLFDNQSTASLSERERRMLEALARCRHYLSDLNGSSWIDGDDAASEGMRQRARGLHRIVGDVIDRDHDLHEALYGDDA